ncbi:S-adenosylmethionine:tRNA ribosyltransferase-isomerase [Halobacteriovorax sp. BALOs_7]|uniref:tRNA preQ1(34) S-adenosylmethionine ribosyltransferase-isomerase QueA n=1 Tax=unclassified Halobacteriovorax TaxID=2639665 RepID=UPI000EB6CEE5|nr:tRNA preQ1(34) S-adenosylmethionine ribosyltransferase-isomerase QueA [Halobacteriovorax sp. BALOs_7]AYF44393.1 S-adenosylmethionine:tRNA ribosyltransferase-isomerase [Halobacteriovorax sp. BALOs_7]
MDKPINKEDLQLSAYDYDLPKELIATRPVEGRHHSRLLVYNCQTDTVSHHTFNELVNFLPQETTLVLNQSKVFPCRLKGKKETGGSIEVFFLTVEPNKDGLYRALVKANGKKKAGDIYHFEDGLTIEINGNIEGEFLIRPSLIGNDLINYLNAHALVPIPPYIRGGESDEQDKKDYQTVFANELGSVAAPTAGLHFTDELLSKIKEEGHDIAKVTLHVGLGTFAPVKVDNLEDHKMHSENYCVDKSDFEKIKNAKKRFAVGTTSLRTLETIWQAGVENYTPGELKDTDIFLHPGVDVKSIDGLITNFHLPKSTLLMLVSALIGREKTLELYDIAVKEKYRFFSYGDAMLILR